MKRSLDNFPKDAQDTVYGILAKAAERRAKKALEKEDKSA